MQQAFKTYADSFNRSKYFLKTELLLPFAKLNSERTTLVRNEFKRFTGHIKAISKHIDREQSLVFKLLTDEKKLEPNSTPVLPSIPENKPLAVLYNPMTNYRKSDWEGSKLTMKSTWIDYCTGKRRLDEHFTHVKPIPTSAF